MPALPRTSARLLRTVRNKQHATEVDHETGSLPTPPTSSSVEMTATTTTAPPSKVVEVEDYMQDPVSSDEEQPPAKSHLEVLAQHTTSASHKRSSQASDSDDDIFGGALSSQQKRAKIASFKKPAKPTIKYGSQSSQPGKANGSTKSGSKFKQSKAVIPSKTLPKETARFKTARSADVFVFGKIGESETHMPSPTSSALSEQAEDIGVEDIQAFEDASALKVRCGICHEQIDLLVKQEYEDRFGKGQRLNLKKQNAFCRFHKQMDAQQTSRERGYPDIDWARLELRMKKQHPRLTAVMNQEVQSVYRDELAKRVAAREDRTLQTTFANSQTPSRSSAGYYGPRGEKLMLEHISAHLPVELREASLKDELISAAGVAGGVSGYVQSVLVPELAVALISQDLQVTESEAHQVLEDSKAIGELLHDEERERVVEALDLVDNVVSCP